MRGSCAQGRRAGLGYCGRSAAFYLGVVRRSFRLVRYSISTVRANGLVATCRSTKSLPALSKHLPCPGKVKVLSPLQKRFLFLVYSDPKKEKENNIQCNTIKLLSATTPLKERGQSRQGLCRTTSSKQPVGADHGLRKTLIAAPPERPAPK